MSDAHSDGTRSLRAWRGTSIYWKCAIVVAIFSIPSILIVPSPTGGFIVGLLMTFATPIELLLAIIELFEFIAALGSGDAIFWAEVAETLSIAWNALVAAPGAFLGRVVGLAILTYSGQYVWDTVLKRE